MRKLLSLLLAFFAVWSLTAPAGATLTNANTPKRYGNNDIYTAMITAASNDTTASFNGPVIDNRDGAVVALTVSANVTNQTGTSPTLQLTVQCSEDGTNFYTCQSQQGSTAGTTAAVQTSAQSISSNVVFGLNTDSYARRGGWSPFLRINGALGGTSPGWTGTIAATVKRTSVGTGSQY